MVGHLRTHKSRYVVSCLTMSVEEVHISDVYIYRYRPIDISTDLGKIQIYGSSHDG